jgi:hypothetical protein
MLVYLYRHQAGGLVTDVVFASVPTDEQLEPLRARMLQAHGATHRRTGEPYWDRVVDVPLLGRGDLPPLPQPSDGNGGTSAGAVEFAVVGLGRVTSPA